MPKELLEYFERKQAKKAMYGAKLAAQGMRVLKEGGQFYNESGKNGSDEPPTVNDLENIRVLRSGDQNQYFLKQGDDQYAPLGDAAALRQQLGDDRFRQYMVNTGFVPNTDKMGNIAPGYSFATSTDDKRSPWDKASKQFTDEFFGTYSGPFDYDRNQLQRAHYENYLAAQSPTIQVIPEGMKSGADVVNRYDPQTMRRTQTEFLLGQLLGGQGGGRGGM